jgi:hypothetical protein
MYFYPKQNTNHSPQTVGKQVPVFFTALTHTDVPISTAALLAFRGHSNLYSFKQLQLFCPT